MTRDQAVVGLRVRLGVRMGVIDDVDHIHVRVLWDDGSVGLLYWSGIANATRLMACPERIGP